MKQAKTSKSQNGPYSALMAHPDAHPFGKKLAKLRQDEGWSQVELGRRLGLSRGMIAYYESCAKNPTVEFVEKVANLFNVSVGDLLNTGGTPKRKPGRTSRLEQLTEELGKLPQTKQRVVIQMLEGFLNQEAS